MCKKVYMFFTTQVKVVNNEEFDWIKVSTGFSRIHSVFGCLRNRPPPCEKWQLLWIKQVQSDTWVWLAHSVQWQGMFEEQREGSTSCHRKQCHMREYTEEHQLQVLDSWLWYLLLTWVRSSLEQKLPAEKSQVHAWYMTELRLRRNQSCWNKADGLPSLCLRGS